MTESAYFEASTDPNGEAAPAAPPAQENGSVPGPLAEAVIALQAAEEEARTLIESAERVSREAAENRIKRERLIGKVEGLALAEGKTFEDAVIAHRQGPPPDAQIIG